jgi:UDP-glucose 4-epimerase
VNEASSNPIRVLVTGGTGFIGQRLVRALSLGGFETWVLCRALNKVPGSWKNLEPSPHLIFCDLMDRGAVEKIKSGLDGITHVVHGAAIIPGSTPPSRKEDFVSNLVMTSNLIACLPPSVCSVIFMSTLDVYGDPLYVPVSEGHPLLPKTLYAASKVACEQYLKLILTERSVRLTVLRVSQVYGPREPVIKAIPKFIHSVMSGHAPTLYGTGMSVRDYVYVDDVVDSILLSLRSLKGGVFNVATGKGVTIKEVAHMVCELSGNRFTPVITPSDQDENRIVLDITQAREQLGYLPRVPLEEGLRTCLQAVMNGIK